MLTFLELIDSKGGAGNRNLMQFSHLNLFNRVNWYSNKFSCNLRVAISEFTKEKIWKISNHAKENGKYYTPAAL